MTVLDIDLDFFVTPIKHMVDGDTRLDGDRYSVEDADSAMEFLHSRCGLPRTDVLPGAIFEHHEELFDHAIARWTEPVHLIHVDAHADIGGGFTRCWDYVCTGFTHLSPERRRFPTRGLSGLNCGNFIVFLAGCGLLEKVTFVSHPDWIDDYNPIYMKNFDPDSGFIQLKRFTREDVDDALTGSPLYSYPHETEAAIPLVRIPRDNFTVDGAVSEVFLTRSPGYTPPDADLLFDRIAKHIGCA